MFSVRRFTLTLIGISGAIAVAGASVRNSQEAKSVVESRRWYADRVETDDRASNSPLGEPIRNTLDVRGMGDTAWTYGARPSQGSPTPPPADFDTAIETADPSGGIFRGDLNFVNWESVVGEHCRSIRPTVDFYFLSHPEAIRQAVAKGFNLFSFANNHSQDCDFGESTSGSSTVPGPRMTSENLARLSREVSVPMNWAGVAEAQSHEDAFTVRVVPFRIGNRTVRVALGAVVSLGWNIPSAASILMGGGPTEEAKITLLLKRFRTADADFRILSIHTQDASGNGRPEGPAFQMLKRISERFVREASGDVVFGQGPHTWGGVKVIRRPDGKLGVVFTSLGNFIHAGLRSDPDNYLARGLWDRDTLRLREVQVHPFKNLRTSLAFYGTPTETKAPNANFRWRILTSEVGGARTVGFSARFLH